MASAILAKSCGYSRRRNSRTARETSCHSFTVSAPCPASCPHPARPGSERHFTHLLRLRRRPLQSLAAVLLRPYFLRSFERSPTRAATFFSESSATCAALRRVLWRAQPSQTPHLRLVAGPSGGGPSFVSQQETFQ